jgi:solute carrier family 35 protein F5
MWLNNLLIAGSAKRTFAVLAALSTCYMAQNYAFVKALQFSSATVDTAIYQSCSVFVYIFSILVLGEEFSWIKIIAVALSIGGVFLISMAETSYDESGSESFSVRDNSLGFTISAVATIAAAGYSVAFKFFFAHVTADQVMLFLGLMGTFHLCVLWLGMPLCQSIGLEVIQIPTGNALVALILSAVIALVVNTLYMLVIHICSPLFISVGMALTVPSTYALDLAVGHIAHVKLETAIGVVINTAGFVALALAPALARAVAGGVEVKAENSEGGERRESASKERGETASPPCIPPRKHADNADNADNAVSVLLTNEKIGSLV